MIKGNPWSRWASLNPEPALWAGLVLAHVNGESRIELPGGAIVTARGTGVAVGQHAFVRGGVVEGPAPVLPQVQIEL